MKYIVRKIFLLAIALQMLFVAGASEIEEQIWLKANNAYSLGEWENALELYGEIEEKGCHSDRLFYNMGNTYYKMGDNGRAILYYERALKLNPANADAANNIKIAQLHTLDKIEVLPQFVLVTWIRDLRNSMGSDAWAIVGIVLLICCIAALFVYRFSSVMGVRKGAFVGAVFMALLTISALSFAWSMRSAASAENSAIVVSAVSNVKSSPNAGGNNLFILHTGTKVEVLENIGPWMRIELADGRQGWMESSSAEII